MNYFIKTKCGLEKYELLKSRRGGFAKLRFYWFVFFASARDIFEKSDSKKAYIKSD